MIGLLLRAKDNHHVDVYTVHESPEPPSDRIDRAEKLVFVKDGFTWSAAVFPPLHFITGGEWAALGAYLGAVTLMSAILSASSASPQSILLAVLALHVFIGFEASSLRRMLLSWRDWREIGSVTGRNLSECERRFFESWLPAQPALAGSVGPRDTGGTLAGTAATALGTATLGQERGWRRLFGADA
jgi:hypothetical protein